MISKYDAISSCVLDHTFRNMDFRNAYMQYCEGPIDLTLPPSLDASLGQEFALKILRNTLCEILIEGGLKQPGTIGEELWANRERTFNTIASTVNVMDFANRFYNNLFDSQNFLQLKPVYYVTSEFLKNVRLDNVLSDVKSVLCPPYTYEYFEDHEGIDL